MAVSIALVSANSEVRAAFITIVDEAPDLELVGVVSTSVDLQTMAQETPELEVVVVDAALPDDSAMELVRELALNSPLIATLAIADASLTLGSLVASGARGILTLPLSLQEVQAQVDNATMWSRSLRQHLTGDLASGGRGRIVALAGAKGGVGVSVLATLLATEAAASGQTVCLVDLDLRAGDLGFLCGVSAKRTVADLAGIAGDLTIRGIREVAVEVPAGFVLLAAPDRVELAEEVSASAVRQLLHELRRNFSLVVVDTGSALDDMRAIALELADEVLLVADCDLISIRGGRRCLDSWDRLNVRSPEQTRLVVNRVSRHRELQPDVVAKLVKLPLLACVPLLAQKLEGPVNTGTLTSEPPAASLPGIRQVLTACLPADNSHLKSPKRSRRFPLARSTTASQEMRSEAGSSILELPAFVMLFMIAFFACIQGLALGVGHMLAGNAADEAARQASVGVSTTELARVGQHAMLGLSFDSDVRVDKQRQLVTVEVRVPKLFGWLPDGLDQAHAQAPYTTEDR